MIERVDRIADLKNALASRILVLDGAMGTMIQRVDPSDEAFGGSSFAGCNEHLVLTAPKIISEIHDAYFLAGADIVETNTFGATPLVLDEYALGSKAYEINLVAAQLASLSASRFTSVDKPRFVAGSIGPTTKALSVTGGTTFEELISTYAVQVHGLYDGGVDYFLIETAQDTRNVKAALIAIETFFKTHAPIPIAVSCTIEPMGTMLAGQSIDAFWASLSHLDLLYMGMNCATGPSFMTDHIRTLSQWSQFPTACIPNAGLPDEFGNYLETPEMMVKTLEHFLASGWINVMGGCCGTTPTYIKAFSHLASRYSPRPLPQHARAVLSGTEFFEVREEERPLLIGERTNVIGSRKFKELIEKNEFESAAEIARRQIKNGAQVIDICMANPDRDELADIELFLSKAIKMIKAPFMIDSTDEKVIARALTYCQGRSIINSINLEDGEERFESVVPLAKKFGAAVVVGTIDEDPDQGMGVSLDRKLSIAGREFKLLTQKYGLHPHDIYWDFLVFPCGTGDKNYMGSAVATIEAIRESKKRFPGTKTTLGISNVSFGLPTAGREVLNSVFLYHCVQAGLDSAIVNTEQLKRYPSIPDEEKLLCDNLLWNRGSDPIAEFAAHFRSKKATKVKAKTEQSLEQRLANYVLEGSKEGLNDDLTLALETAKAMDIINGPLMKGMDHVGKLFNENKLIVAEVLQSAESMKAAVNFLEPFIEKSESSLRGKVLLATVKGDVHDIGKNLVDIILSNNGFEVINLGIKIPPDQLIAAISKYKPDLLGLSGLLVKSAQQMVITAQDLSQANISIPMLVGGAALSRSFVDKFISPAYSGFVEYASDAMNGLELSKAMVDQELFSQLKERVQLRRSNISSTAKPATPNADLAPQHSQVKDQGHAPTPPDFKRHVIRNIPLDLVWSYINPKMLYGRHLGIPNSVLKQLDENPHAHLEKGIQKTLDTIEAIKAYCKTEKLLHPRAVYQFFHAHREGNTLILTDDDSNNTQLGSWEFPRQKKDPFLSISDFVSQTPGRDSIGLFVVTAGEGVRERAEQFKQEGRYLESHALSALGLETAEATAEWLHQSLRRQWQLPEPLEQSMRELFQAQYTGKRYSFGYPACPDLSHQQLLFELLRPEELGIALTDGFMMDPEASVSALVLSHPEACYFHV